MAETVTPEPDAPTSRQSAAFFGRRHVRIGALVAVLAAVAFVAWVLVDRSGGQDQTTSGSAAVAITLAGLRTFADAVPAPIYWVGPSPGATYELTNTRNGRVYVRYLPNADAVGSDKQYLTIATYPLAHAFAATQTAARQKGAVRVDSAPGTIAFFNRSRDESVYFARPGSDYQVEIFDPAAARARSLVASGDVKPVVDKSPVRAKAASVQAIHRLAKSLGHPVYWLGKKPGYTYELARSGGGNVFVRYLPHGVEVGADQPYLTVATYPFPGAYAAVKRVAKQSGSVPMRLDHGGLAVVDANYPKSIHVAYPGSDYQIEVFDPSPSQAHAVVAAGEVRSVG